MMAYYAIGLTLPVSCTSDAPHAILTPVAGEPVKLRSIRDATPSIIRHNLAVVADMLEDGRIPEHQFNMMSPWHCIGAWVERISGLQFASLGEIAVASGDYAEVYKMFFDFPTFIRGPKRAARMIRRYLKTGRVDWGWL